ncbi:MAG: alpha/beta fold hydrolase [Candidatus Omnitrophica bacterium]|nr:alpha/beta fold hydrolase [Candidatus Omnitrophota bacterium]
MRKIYLTVALVFIVSVLLFIVTFIYLDKHNHAVLYYDISMNGYHVGTVKIDKFTTEEKLLYKSVLAMPFGELVTGNKVRIDLDRKYNLESYQKELYANGALSELYAENREKSVSFLSKDMTGFAYISDIPIRKGTFVFEEDSPVTYLPILENYDFRRGRSQGFNSLIFLPDNRMPPMKRFVTLTSVKNEYLKIKHRKIKTENLLLKIKGLPPGNIWVAKSDKSLMMIDIPSTGLRITRSFEYKETEPRERAVTSEKYVSKEITFSGKNRQLSGTFTCPAPGDTPQGGQAYPAVLLIWGAGPQDRDYQGLFRSISDHLSNNGYCVLRFDKRGIGASSGKAAPITPEDEYADIAAALGFLKTQKNVNPARIAVIAHSEGAGAAIKLAADNADIRSVILMAPLVKTSPRDDEALLRDRAAKEKWGDEYLRSVINAMREARDIADKTKRDWAYIMGKRCYLKSLRTEFTDLNDKIKLISAPILILHGKNDTEVPVEYAARLDKALSEHGKMKHSVTYYSYLGHFFGKLMNDGVHKKYYDADKDVLANIRDWLDINNVEPVKIETVKQVEPASETP